MKKILMFNRSEWSYNSVKNYVDSLESVDFDLRVGWSFFLLVPKSNYDVLYLRCEPGFDILCVQYNKNTDSAMEEAFRISDEEVKKIKLSDLLEDIVFDLGSFGFIPEGKRDFDKIYDDVIEFPICRKVNMLSEVECRDLLVNENISLEERKYLLDIFSLTAASLQIMVSLQDKDKNFLKYYASLTSIVFFLRAKLEKIIFLVSLVQEENKSLYQSLCSTKKLKRTFLRSSQTTKCDLVKELRLMIEDFQHIDDYFRSPELHKKGRLLSLICAGNFESLVNEAFSFENRFNQFFSKVLNRLRS